MIRTFPDLTQGSDEWRQARCGLLTASEMKLVITPAQLKAASNDKSRAHLHELAGQRITGYVEPSYVNDDMLRGTEGEPLAVNTYVDHYENVETVGFITNDKWGFTLGYSPDGLVGERGTIEVKCPRQKGQLETIIAGKMPDEHVIQVQTGLLVSERLWCDFISYHGGMPMLTVRVEADAKVQAAIIEAASKFHDSLNAMVAVYRSRLADKANRLVPTERRIEQEMFV